jgi:hypothetical protein
MDYGNLRVVALRGRDNECALAAFGTAASPGARDKSPTALRQWFRSTAAAGLGANLCSLDWFGEISFRLFDLQRTLCLFARHATLLAAVRSLTAFRTTRGGVLERWPRLAQR